MKVIFSDIDGVLNSDATSNPRGFPYVVDPDLLQNLKTLIDRTGAVVVLSSSWRVDPVGLLAAKHYGIPFIDVTPDDSTEGRHTEIRTWLEAHPEVTRHVVLDDQSDSFGDEPLFQTYKSHGLTTEFVDAASRYMNGETEQTVRRSTLVQIVQNVHSLFDREKN